MWRSFVVALNFAAAEDVSSRDESQLLLAHGKVRSKREEWWFLTPEPQRVTVAHPYEYTQIHASADCCVTSTWEDLNPFSGWSGALEDTGTGSHPDPEECQALCDDTKGCVYTSHSTKWEDCHLCAACDFDTSGWSSQYTSWQKVAKYELKEESGDCCRENILAKTDQRFTTSPIGCETMCDDTEGCNYFSHSTKWNNCLLCTVCELTSHENGKYYTSWQKTTTTTTTTRVHIPSFLPGCLDVPDASCSMCALFQSDEGWCQYEEGSTLCVERADNPDIPGDEIASCSSDSDDLTNLHCAAAVIESYQTILCRDPDKGGFHFYYGKCKEAIAGNWTKHASVESLSTILSNSDEYERRVLAQEIIDGECQ